MSNKPNIWIMALEPIETRYTGEWYEHIPALFKEKLGDKFDVWQVDGVRKDTELTPGAFLNFSDTNYWKSSQLLNFLQYLNQGIVGPNDHIVYTDAWNPTAIQLKYMRNLLGHNWTLHGLWHAGSYDPQDFLGRLVGNKPWVRNAEKSMFDCYDHNYFATEFHVELFMKELLNNGYTVENPWFHEDWEERYESGKIVRSGWPMEYLPTKLAAKGIPKKNQIVFPHRIAPEKQVEIFRDLAKMMPEYEFVVCQDRKLTKQEYHTILAESKIVFSCSLQETLGIGVPEGALVGALPLVPHRLSYKEMYPNWCKYPSEWTEDWQSYQFYRERLYDKIKYFIENYNGLATNLNTLNEGLMNNYFSCTAFMDKIRNQNVKED